MTILLYLLPLLFLVPSMLMWRKDAQLLHAAIQEVRKAPVTVTRFPALEAWRTHNRRMTRAVVLGCVACITGGMVLHLILPLP